MTFGLNSGQTLALSASVANAINYSASGLDTTVSGTVHVPSTFATGQLASANTPITVCTPAAGEQFSVTSLLLFNTSPSVSVVVNVYKAGTQVSSVTIPISGSAHYGGGRWVVFDSTGKRIALTLGPGGNVSSVANTDSTLTVSTGTGNVVVSRASITGDVTVPTGSNVSTVSALAGLPLTGPGPSNGYALIANQQGGGPVSLQWQSAPLLSIQGSTGVTGPTGFATYASTQAVYNILSYGADPTGTNPSDAAITAAVAAAGQAGTVIAPPGNYKIASLITVGGFNTSIHFIGAGGASSPPPASPSHNGVPTQSNAATTFTCSTATAGLLLDANGALYQGFMVNGAGIATNPLQRGVPVNSSQGSGGYSYFVDVWAMASAGGGTSQLPSANIAFLQGQNDKWFACGSLSGLGDSIFFGSGTGGHDFYGFYDQGSAGAGIHLDGSALVSHAGYVDYVGGIHFHEGYLDNGGHLSSTGTRVLIRWAHDVGIHCYVDGSNTTGGPTVEIDPSAYSIDLQRMRVNANTGQACVQFGATGTGAIGYNDQAFPDSFWLDDMHFLAGKNAFYFMAAPGTDTNFPAIYARNWQVESTITTPVAIASGITLNGNAVNDANPILLGRTGPWISIPTLSNGWGGSSLYYRINANGRVEFRGGIGGSAPNIGASNTSPFSLPNGYTPAATSYVPLVADSGTAYMKVSTIGATGTVTILYSGSPTNIYFDGASFIAARLAPLS